MTGAQPTTFPEPAGRRRAAIGVGLAGRDLIDSSRAGFVHFTARTLPRVGVPQRWPAVFLAKSRILSTPLGVLMRVASQYRGGGGIAGMASLPGISLRLKPASDAAQDCTQRLKSFRSWVARHAQQHEAHPWITSRKNRSRNRRIAECSPLNGRD